jgi:type I restriction enzyme, S subunit
MSSEGVSAVRDEQDRQGGLVPKLRFPEFHETGDWDQKTLAAICEMKAGKFVSATDISDKFEDGLYLCFGGNGLRGYTKTFTHTGKFPLIGRQGALCGNVNLGSGSFYATEHAIVVKAWGSASVDWLYHLLVHFDLNQFKSGQAQPGLSVEVLDKLPCAVPKQRAEQQKIADCLSSIDALIAAEGGKLVALKDHKRGLMQQIFPAPGETNPRLRFPEFQDAGDWEEKPLNDLKPFVTSGSRGWAAFYADRGELFVRMTNLWRGSIHLDLTASKFVQLPPGANEGVRTQLKEHDVLISITADIGIIGYIDESVPMPAYINQHIALVRFDPSHVCGKYVAYYLSSERSQRLFRASTDNGTKAGMSLIGIQKIELMLPSLSEQQRVAAFLSSIDTLITAQCDKIHVVKAHKRGLMQQLFPVADEVQG